MRSSVHIDIKKKYILIFGERPTQRLDRTTLTAAKKYAISFTESRKKCQLSVHYNEQIVIYFLMIQKFINLKQKTNFIPLCQGN